MPVKHLPIIDEIRDHLAKVNLIADTYNAHLYRKFMYVTFLCHNTMTNMDTTVIAKINTDNSYKLYVELD